MNRCSTDSLEKHYSPFGISRVDKYEFGFQKELFVEEINLDDVF